MCKNSEITNQQLRKLSNKKEATVNSVKHGKTKKKSKTLPAKAFSGRRRKKRNAFASMQILWWKASAEPEAVPSIGGGVTCSNCKKMHHFAKVCKQGKKPGNVNMLDHDSSSDESVFTVEHSVGTVKALGEKCLQLSI